MGTAARLRGRSLADWAPGGALHGRAVQHQRPAYEACRAKLAELGELVDTLARGAEQRRGVGRSDGVCHLWRGCHVRTRVGAGSSPIARTAVGKGGGARRELSPDF